VGCESPALPETCRRKSLSMTPILEVVECDHLLIFRLGERPRSGAVSRKEGLVVASMVEMYWFMESELVGLACEVDFLCPIFAPNCLTVETEEVVEFDEDSRRLTAGGRAEWLIFVAGLKP